MITTWFGRKFEISGLLYGSGAPWMLVKENGVKMTAEQFNALPIDGKVWLTDAVQSYLDNINKLPEQPT